MGVSQQSHKRGFFLSIGRAFPLFLLCLCAHAAGDCRQSADALIGKNFWTQFYRSEGRRTFRLTSLEDADVSPRTRNAMERLERNGGRGTYVKIEFFKPDGTSTRQKKGIQVASPPTTPIYGSAFDEIFAQLDAAGVPAIIDAHMNPIIWGLAHTANHFSNDVQTVFLINHRFVGNLANRHELQHIFDDHIQLDKFMRTWPEGVDTKLRPVAKKVAAGKAIDRSDELKVKAVKNYLWALEEARASEANLGRLFTAQGFKDIFLTRTVVQETLVYISEIVNATVANGLFFIYSLAIDPKNPRNIVVALKTAAGTFIIYNLIGQLIAP